MTESRAEKKAREAKETAVLVAQFQVGGGVVDKLESIKPGQIQFCLGKLVNIRHIPTGGQKYDFHVFSVYVFDTKKTINIQACKQDRAGVEVGKSYRFTYETHQGMEYIKAPYVTRGQPTELSTSAKIVPSELHR